jgi:hypothetical protein
MGAKTYDVDFGHSAAQNSGKMREGQGVVQWLSYFSKKSI